MAQVSVVTELQTKDRTAPDGQKINPIGADVKYIKSNRFANNNLEEELLLGPSRLITISNDFEKQAVVKRIEYRASESQAGDYYVLVVYQYGKNIDNDIDITSNEDVLQFVITNSGGYPFPANSDPKIDGNGGIHLNKNFYLSNNYTELHQRNYDKNVIYNASLNKLLFLPTIKTEESYLYYIDSEENSTLIASKEINEYWDTNNIHKITEIVTVNNNE